MCRDLRTIAMCACRNSRTMTVRSCANCKRPGLKILPPVSYSNNPRWIWSGGSTRKSFCKLPPKIFSEQIAGQQSRKGWGYHETAVVRPLCQAHKCGSTHGFLGERPVAFATSVTEPECLDANRKCHQVCHWTNDTGTGANRGGLDT